MPTKAYKAQVTHSRQVILHGILVADTRLGSRGSISGVPAPKHSAILLFHNVNEIISKIVIVPKMKLFSVIKFSESA